METMLIAVGSTRRPKLNGVREALADIGPRLKRNVDFDIAAVEVPSSVRHTPLSREDTMAGARHRAEELVRMARAKNKPWNYFVGLEGGLDVVRDGADRRVFLQNWAYVTDGSGLGAFGQSGAVLLPEPLVRHVVDEGVELSEAVDRLAGGHGIRDAQGAWGILTRDIITRQDAFRIAVISAFAPFFNRQLYTPGLKEFEHPATGSGPLD
jgi:inosine/xanthosine triphosphatase